MPTTRPLRQPTSAGRAAVVNLDPDSLFVTNKDLDFSFCAVKGLEYLGFVPLERDSLSVVPSESVNIIQHPRGRYKEVALQDNRVVKVDNLVVQYCCDTEPGSSGSPVFNNHWHLVALHHASVVVDDKDGGRCACGHRPRRKPVPQRGYPALRHRRLARNHRRRPRPGP